MSAMSPVHSHVHYVLLRGQSLTISLASHGRTSRACKEGGGDWGERSVGGVTTIQHLKFKFQT